MLVGFVKYLPAARMNCTIPRFTVSCSRYAASHDLLRFGWLLPDSVKCKGVSWLLGVVCSLAPYFIIIQIITALVNGTAELSRCLTLCAWMAGFWVLRYVPHSVSTSLSHHATFHVLARTRTRLLDKLATLPLGTVLDRSSGSYKNIIVERVDSIETTLAHLLPEMTANIVGALAVLVLLFLEDWRMGLSMLIVVPLGIGCFASMFSGYHEKFRRTVTATKALNDTAVEYISGIEVIKAFGQSKTSYAKFVSAAKEGADCFIDWMRGSLFGQVAGMAILPFFPTPTTLHRCRDRDISSCPHAIRHCRPAILLGQSPPPGRKRSG